MSFRHGNILNPEEDSGPVADIGVMLGLLNFNWRGEVDNLAYSRQAIRNAFRLVRRGLIVDFLSSHLTADYPAEEFVYYHEPDLVLRLGLELTPCVLLKHDYVPIPQQEFMLVLTRCGP